MSLLQLQIAREARFARAKTIPLPELQETPLNGGVQTYFVSDVHYSENAILLFCNHHVVIKRLLAYKDLRYDLKELHSRQECLLEGLEWNRTFTDKIHLGVAPIREWKLEDNLRTISLGETLVNPQPKDLDPDAEYVLLMRKLPKEYRLDYLLNGVPGISQQCYAHMLTEYLSSLHKRLQLASSKSRDAKHWGSVTQLYTKLINNLDTVDKPVGVRKEILQSGSYDRLKLASAHLNEKLLSLFDEQEYCNYFEQRAGEGHIKRCHGDLKARNIWILPSEFARKEELQEGVYLLDAIDFNQDYCNIDTLSDFAMLAVDLQVRTFSYHLANYMIEEYLHRSNQTDKTSRKILNYYLVEKAFVGAYVNILYDDRPDLGEAYLQAVDRNLAMLESS